MPYPIQEFTAFQDGMNDRLNIAQRIKSMALQQQQAELNQTIFQDNRDSRLRDDNRLESELQLRRKEHDDVMARNAAQDQRQKGEDAYTTLARTLALAQNPALVSIGANDTTRPYDFQGMTDKERLMGFPDTVDVPVENAVEYGGKRFAIRNQGEVQSRGLAEDLKRARATEEAKDPLVDVPGVGRVRKSLADDYLRQQKADQDRLQKEQQAKEAEAGRNSRAANAEAGRNGRVRPKYPPKPAADGLALKRDRAELSKLEGDEAKVVAAVKDPKKAATLKFNTKRLAEIRKRKDAVVGRLEGGGGGPAASGGASEKTPVAKIRVRLSDGQEGMIDPSDFDAKSMKKF